MRNNTMHLSGRHEIGLTLNAPAALKGGGVHRLPPYAPVITYEVDAYPGAPRAWMRSEGNDRSYFVGVAEGRGLWLDFNKCFDHDHDVAVLISVQGLNPVTGMKCGKPVLEKYDDRCPRHDEKFEAGRMCKSCGYRWPSQNFLSTAATPDGILWLDGFMGPDGSVRQYILTEETMRGVAAQVIGDARSFAIGVAFFLSKKPHPERPKHGQLMSGAWPVPEGWEPPQGAHVWHSTYGVTWAATSTAPNTQCFPQGQAATQYLGQVNMYNSSTADCTLDASKNCTGAEAYDKSLVSPAAGKKDTLAYLSAKRGKGVMRAMSMSLCSFAPLEAECDIPMAAFSQAFREVPDIPVAEVETKSLEIGAGSQIEQRVYDDTNPLEYWESSPAGVIYVNYCDPKACAMILETKSVGTKATDGFMAGLKVGNG